MILFSLAFFACNSNQQHPEENSQVRRPNAPDTGTMALGQNPEGPVEVAPVDRLPRRDRKRMDLDQLRANIVYVSGGIEWTSGYGSGGTDMLNKFSATLGVPDYFLTTIEDKGPSLVFEKFLGDAAKSVCTKLIEQEATGLGDGVFLSGVTVADTWDSNPTAIEDNIILQLERFHGLDIPSGDPELDQWVWLFQTVHR